MTASPTPVLDLLADESRWCKGSVALDANSRETEYVELACSYCVYGAIKIACHYDSSLRETLIRNRISEVLRHRHPESEGRIACFNDSPSTTHAMVVAVLKEAGV